MQSVQAPLQVRILKRGTTPIMLLCDANGIPLPGQQRVVVDGTFNDVPIVTVTFLIGKSVILAPGDG